MLLNFWASWCVPCREEFPLFEAKLAEAEADGLAIVGVLFKDEPGPARDFASDFGATWPTIVDPDGSAAATYLVIAPPQSFFIDRDGILRSIQIGEVQESDFDRQYALISGAGTGRAASRAADER